MVTAQSGKKPFFGFELGLCLPKQELSHPKADRVWAAWLSSSTTDDHSV